ncbi:hypothetical protein E2562_023325 [Oryza meyeriana var. granulata]|uniref:DUF674 domain-containing protein n=1 Tax=Oryza meyeriana var. granulata TaxID=110450 RepID=A0A6G1E178_9ORYZ|nr:hypothetical protein E2562_023325 [Oryza meyeriana var. granulata]
MAGKTPAASLTLKLLVDTKAQRVLYAEGSKDVVDFLLSLLAVPLGGVTKLLTAGAMVGSVGNLYSSIDKLGDGYACRGDVKAALMATSRSRVLRLDLPDDASPSRTNNGALYRCNGCACSKRCYNFVTKVNGTPCRVCEREMTTLVRLVEPDYVTGGAKIVTSPAPASDEASGSKTGYMPGMATYTVMDDLTVAPSSTVSAVTALVALGVTDIRGLQEKTVEVGNEEASLQSKTVLTDVFLGERRSAHRRPSMLV